MDTDFDQVYEIMLASLPKAELRSYNDQKSLLNNKRYKLTTHKNKNQEIDAFMAVWEFDEYNYIEHLAVRENSRSKGIGGSILSQYLSLNSDKLVIVEVDPPIDEQSCRRVRFYENKGFVMNDFKHYQPELQKGMGKIELRIMTYPNKITYDEFLNTLDIFKNNGGFISSEC